MLHPGRRDGVSADACPVFSLARCIVNARRVGCRRALEYDAAAPELACVLDVGDEIVATASGITAAGQVRVQCVHGWISLKSAVRGTLQSLERVVPLTNRRRAGS